MSSFKGCSRKGSSGFTIIELVMIVVVIAVVAAVAAPRFENLPNTRAQYAIEKIRSDIRYAQFLAIQTQSRTRVTGVVATNSYSLEIETAPGVWTLLQHPANKNNFSVTLNVGDYEGVMLTDVAGSVSPAGTIQFLFNSYGAPFWSDDSPLASPAYLELNSTYQIHISPETGNLAITP